MHPFQAFFKMTNFSKNQGKKLNRAQKSQIHLDFRIFSKNIRENTAKKSCKETRNFFPKTRALTYGRTDEKLRGNSRFYPIKRPILKVCEARHKKKQCVSKGMQLSYFFECRWSREPNDPIVPICNAYLLEKCMLFFRKIYFMRN